MIFYVRLPHLIVSIYPETVQEVSNLHDSFTGNLKLPEIDDPTWHSNPELVLTVGQNTWNGMVVPAPDFMHTVNFHHMALPIR